MEKPMKSSKLPKTDSIHELAEFWDTHDLTDFQDQLEEVPQPVFESTSASAPIRIQLTPTEATAVRRLAKSAGVSQAVLIHKWVRQKLKPHKNGVAFRD